MKRDLAVEVIKEIGVSCKFLNPTEIVLQETNDAEHFEIHVKGHVDDESWECLKKLAQKHDLGIRLTDHMLVICAPVGKTFGKLSIS